MPLDEGLVKETAKSCETAIVIIGRTAGEEQDNRLEAGSYLLSDDEIAMLTVVREHFKKVVLLLNVGNIIDMTDINRIAPDAVLYVWQGGMTGGKGTADVLTGKVSPSGKLPDTIAYKASDYPSDANFGREENRDIYAEDIYVGYRYFETFAKEKVLYPFGFGLSAHRLHIFLKSRCRGRGSQESMPQDFLLQILARIGRCRNRFLVCDSLRLSFRYGRPSRSR